MRAEFFLEECVDSPDSTPPEEAPVEETLPEQALAEQIHAEEGAAEEVVTPQRIPPVVTSGSRSGNTRKVSPRDNVRKRQVHKAAWKISLAKKNYNAGIEHETSRGVLRKARELKPPCPDACRRCKSRRLLNRERIMLFKDFWALRDVSRKRDYLSRCMSVSQPKSINTLPEKAKSGIRKYTFTIGAETIKICKTMFLNTLGINSSWTDTALKCTASGKGVSPDKRGHHNTRPMKTPTEALEKVRLHINSFPKMQSHYVREKSKREYFTTGLRSVEQMHSLYMEWCKENYFENEVSISIYRKVFNTEFNIGFFLPRKDQCELCHRWKTAKDSDERREMLTEYSKHLESKKSVQQIKKEDKGAASAKKCVACFDLQKVLRCPKSEVSMYFYKNTLSLLNFTIFDLRLKEGHCYLWNETEALKGANEVATNVFSFIQERARSGTEEFIFYSDGPSGQNRNRMVFSMFLIACQKYRVSIVHRFLESGHSYSEVDSMHARIEKAAFRREIYSEQEWYNLIESAKTNGEKYLIHPLKNEDVLDFHHLVNLQKWNNDVYNQQVKWSKVRELTFSWRTPNALYYRYDFKAEPKRVEIKFKKVSDTIDLQHYIPPTAYNKKFPLKPNKANDIRTLMQKRAIPTRYHELYDNVLSVK